MDDEVLGCGGLIQRLVDVKVLFMTEAAMDVRLTEKGPVEYSGTDRLVEMQAVAASLGFEYERMMYPVHELDCVGEGSLVSEVGEVLAASKADRLLIPGPSHDADHEATRRVVGALMRPHCYAGTVLEYMTWGCPTPYEPAVIMPLTDIELGLKVKAMECYRTQVQAGGVEDELYPYGGESIKAFAAATGRLVHSRWAEAYLPRRVVGVV